MVPDGRNYKNQDGNLRMPRQGKGEAEKNEEVEVFQAEEGAAGDRLLW